MRSKNKAETTKKAEGAWLRAFAFDIVAKKLSKGNSHNFIPGTHSIIVPDVKISATQLPHYLPPGLTSQFQRGFSPVTRGFVNDKGPFQRFPILWTEGKPLKQLGIRLGLPSIRLKSGENEKKHFIGRHQPI